LKYQKPIVQNLEQLNFPFDFSSERKKKMNMKKLKSFKQSIKKSVGSLNNQIELNSSTKQTKQITPREPKRITS